MPRDERRIEPLERQDSRRHATRDATLHRYDAMLDVAHRPFRPLGDAAGSSNRANRAEHASEVVSIEGKDRGTARQPPNPSA